MSQSLERFEVDEGTYLIDWRGEFTPAEQGKLKNWLTHMGTSVSQLHGAWPRPTIRIAFKPYRSNSQWANGPVPFAQILRNAPEGILFYVNPDEALPAFINDWTAYHEFSHLFITYPGRSGSWFSEGLASYYQNILQLRAGVLTAAEARARYTAAFGRGAADNKNGDLTLAELSTRMIERRAFMRVYWSGALYFLEADLALRALPEPGSLDAVLRDYNACCLRQGAERPAREIAEEFDRLAGAAVFVPLFDRYAASRSIPDYADVLESAAFTQLLNQSVAMKHN